MGFLDDVLGGSEAKQKKLDSLHVESAILDKQMEIEKKKKELRDLKAGR